MNAHAKRFENKVAVITGGASGMGFATAERLAGEGAHVIIADVDDDKAAVAVARIAEAGGKASFVRVDLLDDDSVRALAGAVAAEAAAVHVLVNCAGIPGGPGRVELNGGQEAWDRVMGVNLRAAAMVTHVLLPLLRKGAAAIVNVTSDGGHKARAGSWIYDASKAGLSMLTRSMAAEFVGYGIRVNEVAPGWCVTEFHFARAEDPEAKKRELEQLDTDYCLMRRLGRPEEIAAAAAFLASDEASYVTGATLCVDGGRVGIVLPAPAAT
jgi:NAD(P)-dependent dehydrogenase (short-subunit alcohol dehydrogenase family)